MFGLAVVTGTMLLAQTATAPPPPATGEAQDQPAPVHNGWPQASNSAPAVNSPVTAQRNEYGAPAGVAQQAAPEQGQPPQPVPPANLPATLTLKPGTFITVRVNDTLSSNHSHPGDAFTATLLKPVVVDGIVVAEEGQTLAGRVVSVEKGGHFGGVSKLGIELTDLPVVDGSQVPVQSQLISREAPGTAGRDAGTVAVTTGTGALIGAAADLGRGAAIGAGAGAAAGLVGVLLTHGHPSVIDPESVLTFRLLAPVTVSTTRAPQAFRYVEPDDYQRAPALQPQRQVVTRSYMWNPYWDSMYYPYWGWGSYWGPGLGFYYGPSYFGGGHYFRGRGHFGGGHFGRGGHARGRRR